jgi:hypothetical protein
LIAVASVMVEYPRWVPQQPVFTARELMQALKEAPKTPGDQPADLLQETPNDPGLDRMVLDLDTPPQDESMQGETTRKAEPTPPEPPPRQKVILGTLPAIPFEIVEP